MATTKLTLSMSEEAIRLGKELARESGTSLSKLVEGFILEEKNKTIPPRPLDYVHPEIERLFPEHPDESTGPLPDYWAEYAKAKHDRHLQHTNDAS